MSEIGSNPLREEKRRKLHALREMGVNPFPYRFERTSAMANLRSEFDSKLKAGEKLESQVERLAGRLMTLRSMGKAAFFNLQDQSGHLQFYVRLEELEPRQREIFQLLDLGDILGVEGFVFKTQKGELSLHVKQLELLTKTIEPLPEKFHGVQDVEIKYRHRHLDLISDEESRKVFATRSRIIREIRNFMDARGFLEVETPVLQPIYGGAAAHPFSTHHRALDMKLFLKISPELYLKRLIVGGFEKVYEITKNFRNEGIDRTHNPEFTMMEWYEAYTDYNDQMSLFEKMVCEVVKSVKGTLEFEYQGRSINFSQPWRRITIEESVRESAGIDPRKISESDLFDLCKKHGSDLKKPSSRGKMLLELFELLVEPNLWDPTFVLDHPVEVSPLTKRHRVHAHLVERFEPFAAGMEIGNAYSELNDPEEQHERLKEQESQRVVDEEAQPMDEDFMHAIDTGMPPTGGAGLGIERLVMILTDRASIRDIIFFPTMKLKGLKGIS